MDRQALSIYYLTEDQKAELVKTYSQVQGTIASQAVSMRLKNTQVEGDVAPGATVKVRRMATSVSDPYGTARAAGKGRYLKDNGVKMEIDTDREIVEEINRFDADKFGVPNLVQGRSANHALSMRVTLDRAYFECLENAAVANGLVNVSGATGVEDKLLLLIEELESLENENVKGVDPEMIVLTVAPKWYHQLRKVITAMTNPAGQSINLFHDVEIVKATRQKFDAIIQVRGAVAQPVVAYPYSAEKINLGNEVAVELFYHFGTKAVMPDTVFACALDGDISA